MIASEKANAARVTIFINSLHSNLKTCILCTEGRTRIVNVPGCGDASACLNSHPSDPARPHNDTIQNVCRKTWPETLHFGLFRHWTWTIGVARSRQTTERPPPSSEP